ncbi:hypothetical protein [Schleiferilactobacillus harbinensis]|uniref:hypothetical protein n=1 Tax=Schleiferilactobacillus harbinensis TaxID=304207 RepID=UPI0021A2EAAB|nr:hypothetical protein [Schleiferilactobacillus harbinensis]
MNYKAVAWHTAINRAIVAANGNGIKDRPPAWQTKLAHGLIGISGINTAACGKLGRTTRIVADIVQTTGFAAVISNRQFGLSRKVV